LTATYRLETPHPLLRGGLVPELPDGLHLEVGSEDSVNWSALDTFDWRLFNKDLALLTNGRRAVLYSASDWANLDEANLARKPRFVADLPEGAIRNRVGPLLDVRALLEVARFSWLSTSLFAADKRGKKICSLVQSQIREKRSVGEASPLFFLTLRAVRGYEKETRKATDYFLEEFGCQLSSLSPLARLLESADRRPGAYTTRPAQIQDPAEASANVIPRMLRTYIRVIRANEGGILRDIDTEFLHDFRVASRRTRSLLREFEDLFTKSESRRFRKDISQLGKRTNTLRDLDVYLLSEKLYRTMVPPEMNADLDPIFAHLRRRRTSERKSVSRFLRSQAYDDSIKNWGVFLEEEAPRLATEFLGSESVSITAVRKIWKKYRRVVKLGRKIGRNSPDEEFHELRLKCKQLRYLIEFFSSLFPGIQEPRKRLKALQDDLGKIQDFAVQAETLGQLASDPTFQREAVSSTYVAIGALIAALEKKKSTARKHVLVSFGEFASPQARKALAAVLAEV